MSALDIGVVPLCQVIWLMSLSITETSAFGFIFSIALIIFVIIYPAISYTVHKEASLVLIGTYKVCPAVITLTLSL